MSLPAAPPLALPTRRQQPALSLSAPLPAVGSRAAFAPLPLLRRELPSTPAAGVAAAVLPLPGAPLLALSPDEALLAACADATVHVFATQQLLAGSVAEVTQRQLPAKVLQLAWRPGSTTGEFAALLEDGSIHTGSLASAAPPAPLAAAAGLPAACLAWGPDGGRLAVGAGDEVGLYVPEQGSDSWRQAAAIRVLSNEVQDDDQELQVGWLFCVCWMGDWGSALLRCRLS